MRPAAVLLLCLVLVSTPVPAISVGPGPAAAAERLAQTNPAEFVLQTSQNELEESRLHRPSLRYQLRKVTDKSDTTKEIVETSNGAVARLIAVGGRPLSPAQQQQEIVRLRALLANPAIEAHRLRSETRDADRVTKFTRMLPKAFLYRYAGSVQTPSGRLVRLTFTPNPRFSPPDFASRIVTGIRGELWIDPEERRIARIQGRIFTPVDFGWGILGRVFPGGTLLVEQSRTPACGWQMTHLSVHLVGKALIFRSFQVAIEETASEYQSVPRGWTYRDAVQWLLRPSSAPTP